MHCASLKPVVQYFDFSTAGIAYAGSAAIIEFLSENSSTYEISDVGFFKGLVRDANTSVRRAVGDMVGPCTLLALCMLFPAAADHPGLVSAHKHAGRHPACY